MDADSQKDEIVKHLVEKNKRDKKISLRSDYTSDKHKLKIAINIFPDRHKKLNAKADAKIMEPNFLNVPYLYFSKSIDNLKQGIEDDLKRSHINKSKSLKNLEQESNLDAETKMKNNKKESKKQISMNDASLKLSINRNIKDRKRSITSSITAFISLAKLSKFKTLFKKKIDSNTNSSNKNENSVQLKEDLNDSVSKISNNNNEINNCSDEAMSKSTSINSNTSDATLKHKALINSQSNSSINTLSETSSTTASSSSSLSEANNLDNLYIKEEDLMLRNNAKFQLLDINQNRLSESNACIEVNYSSADGFITSFNLLDDVYFYKYIFFKLFLGI